MSLLDKADIPEQTAHGGRTETGTEERREGEGLTEFTMRRVRNSIIEECAKVAEGERLRDRTGEAEDEAYNLAISHAAQAIRGLKR